ncbi:MAG: TatD family hydrolase [Dehalococcoidia bacterium]|nr:TatD family hydrolase [Dehalococcoidia bacterium]
MIVDTHAHLDGPEFDADRDAVIRRAVESGVGAIVSAGVDMKSSMASLELAKEYACVYSALGFHPHEATGLTQSAVDDIERLSVHPKVVAIGEIGLDFYRNLSPRETQMSALEIQLEMASRADLPVIVHCRQANIEILDVLRRWASRRGPGAGRPLGVVHCFSGDEKEGRELIDLGFLVSFAGPITFPRSRRPKRVAAALPLSGLMVETDCPYLTPSVHFGQRNEPSFVWAVAQGLADAKGANLEDVASVTTENAIRLFGLSLTRKEDFGQTRPFPAYTARPA